MTLELYHNPVSTCSQKVRLVLAEKNLPYESKVIVWGNNEHLTEEYLKINPNGVVPSLVHDDDPVIDSSVICEYLDEVFPGVSLTPTDPVARARMRAWMRYFEEVPTAAIRVPSFNMLFKKQLSAMPSEAFNNMTDKLPLRKQFYKEMGQAGFSEQKFDASLERLSGCIDRVTEALTDGGPWIIGEQYTIADIVLLPSIVRMIDLKLDHLWAGNSVFETWIQNSLDRQAFDVAFMPGSRISIPTSV